MPEATPPSLLVAASVHRSGSTLLQRYITAATDCFVWGENGWLVQSLRRAWESWPRKAHDEDSYRAVMSDPSVVERAFMPNLSPPVDEVTGSFRQAIQGIYSELPTGFERWGWKDVGYGREDLDFVRTLFPDIDVVLLVRDPWDVARSIRKKGWIDKRGYFRDMEEVATHWTERTTSYLDLASVDDERVLLVQYEHLDRRIADLNRFLDIDEADTGWKEVSSRKLGTAPRVSRYDLTPEDVETIESIAGDVATDLGYTPPSTSGSLFGGLI